MWSAKIFGAKVLSNHSTFILSLVRQHGAMDDVTNGLSTGNRIQPQRFRLSHWSHGMSWPSWLQPRVVDVWHWSLEAIIYLVPRMSQQPEANSFKLRFEWQGTYSLGEKKTPTGKLSISYICQGTPVFWRTEGISKYLKSRNPILHANPQHDLKKSDISKITFKSSITLTYPFLSFF